MSQINSYLQRGEAFRNDTGAFKNVCSSPTSNLQDWSVGNQER